MGDKKDRDEELLTNTNFSVTERIEMVLGNHIDYGAEYEQQVFLIGGINDDYAEGATFALGKLNATIAALGLGGIPNCPDCGNNRQVWVNQITGKMTCHRAGCHKEI